MHVSPLKTAQNALFLCDVNRFSHQVIRLSSIFHLRPLYFVFARPRFETWDLEDVPPVLLDFARRQGAEQANLVASSVGDTMARDWGYWTGHFTGDSEGERMDMG